MAAVIITVTATAITAFFWVQGATSMKDNNPDYKGKDFLDE